MSKNWDLEQDPVLIEAFKNARHRDPREHFVCTNTNASKYQKLCTFLDVPKQTGKIPFFERSSMIQFTGDSCYSIWLPVIRFLAGKEFKVPEFIESLEHSCSLLNGNDLDDLDH